MTDRNSDSRIPRDQADSPAGAAVSKAVLRRRLADARSALPIETRAVWDAALGQQLLAWCQRGGWPQLGVYWALAGEPALDAAYAALAARGVALLLPVVVEKHAALAFAHWTPGEVMLRDKMGVAVPADLRLAPTPAALLVPCLGFSPARLRLGYGGGYYDRTLALPPRPATAGIAYACQAVDFDGDEHDIALDIILTEQGPL
jgi:5,10-methenyltetrahydrofolate synthetase